MSGADDESVTALLRSFEAAWAQRDADRLASLFTDDADYIDFAGDLLRGRDTIAGAHAAVLAGPLARSTFTFTDAQAAPLGSGVVLVITNWKLEGQQRSDGSAVATRRGIITFIVLEQDSRAATRFAIRAGQNTEARIDPFA